MTLKLWFVGKSGSPIAKTKGGFPLQKYPAVEKTQAREIAQLVAHRTCMPQVPSLIPIATSYRIKKLCVFLCKAPMLMNLMGQKKVHRKYKAIPREYRLVVSQNHFF